MNTSLVKRTWPTWLIRDSVVRLVVLLAAGLCVRLTTWAQIQPDTAVALTGFRVVADTTNEHQIAGAFAIDVTQTLAHYGPSFTYDFGAFGWPNGWSLWGASPQQVDLQFSGIPYNDLITGRPRYDMLPTALLRPPEVDRTSSIGVASVTAELRDFAADGPLTELHYQAGDLGLQRVTALHAQQLNALLPGEGRLHGMLAYAGAGANGAYPGSQLQRMRQLLLRVRLQKRRMSMEITYLHNQQRLGAHSGVIGDQRLRYNILIASVDNLGARRRDVRNDLIAVARTRLIPSLRKPLVAIASVSSQRLRFSSTRSDVNESSVRRGVFELMQDFEIGAHRAQFALEGRVSAASDDPLRVLGARRSYGRMSIRDRVRFGPMELVGQAGAHVRMNHWSAHGSAGIAVGWRHGSLGLNAVHTPSMEARVMRDGWTDFLLPNTFMPGAMSRIQIQLRQSVGPWDFESVTFVQRRQDVEDYYEVATDSVVVGHLTGSNLGAAIKIGFRQRAQRGLYGSVAYWLMRHDNESSVAMTALPNWAANALVGVRYSLFTGDLILDLTLKGRMWGRMHGRILHAPTGLLVLPSSNRQEMLSAGTLDVVATGQVRTATLFVAYENVLSNTPITNGVEIVPGYPLPAQRLRFGVSWPIIN